MEDDWDLYAVVRSCSAAAAATTTNTRGSTPLCKNPQQDFSIPCFEQDYHFETPTSSSSTSNSIYDLNDLYRPFFPKSQNPPPQTVPTVPPPPISPLSVLGGLQEFLPSEKPPLHPMVGKPFLPLQTELLPKQSKPSSIPRSKRRKNHLKKVCHVAAEDLSSDQWSWRKYGQKPIKGSPYPRGYYRCSTSKGCLARKQVERNRSDPGMFILTYTGEHNHPIPTHRNSLAGSTRHKASSDDSGKALPERVESSSREEDLPEVEEEEDDGLSLSDEPNMALDDDFFAGLEDFGGAGDCVGGHFPAEVLFNWSSDSGAAAAACGGC